MGKEENLKPFKKGEPRAKKAGAKGGAAPTGRFKGRSELARLTALQGWAKRKGWPIPSTLEEALEQKQKRESL